MILFIEADLNDLRDRIKGIDYSIVSLISQRISLAKKVGKLKQKANLPIRNYQAERQVYQRIHRYVEEFDLDETFIRPIFEQIIASSVNAQKEELIINKTNQNKLKFLLIGGSGKMGSWFQNFFITSGYTVHIQDPTLKDSDSTFSKLPSSLDYDFIGICTPLELIPSVIQELVSRSPKAIIFEIGSLKSHILTDLENAKREKVNIVACHPLFGPDVTNLDGRNMVICDFDLSNKHHRKMNELFEETSLNIVSLPLIEHDRIMLYTLGLSHFINLLHGEILRNSNIAYEELEIYASTTFLKQVNTTKEVYSESPDLYFSIQNMNDYRSELWTKIMSSVEMLKEATSDGGISYFKQIMASVNSYFNNEKTNFD
ncbi:MAG: bifunctional chorismate mutase/prephenate dehydrogenase [Candidatus Heimdallarchaeota archaeon]|nr:bifunctional chorismate mutase/prephenate dehydrogenase [Candidatus Heimdallarchaeota archaeon]